MVIDTLTDAPDIVQRASVSQGRYYLKVRWGSGNDRARAFHLYNEYSGERRLSPGCGPCHDKVYRWLKAQSPQTVIETSDRRWWQFWK